MGEHECAISTQSAEYLDEIISPSTLSAYRYAKNQLRVATSHVRTAH
jgi:hypothetical protein